MLHAATNTFILMVVMLSVVILRVVMLRVFLLNVIMLSVVAPFQPFSNVCGKSHSLG